MGQVEHPRHLFRPRRPRGQSAHVREAGLRRLERTRRLAGVRGLGLEPGDPPAQVCPPRVKGDAWVGPGSYEAGVPVDALGRNVPADDHAAEKLTRDAVVAAGDFDKVIKGSLGGLWGVHGK